MFWYSFIVLDLLLSLILVFIYRLFRFRRSYLSYVLSMSLLLPIINIIVCIIVSGIIFSIVIFIYLLVVHFYFYVKYVLILLVLVPIAILIICNMQY